MDSQQSCKLAVHEQLDVQGGNTDAEHSSSHLPLSQMKPTELARPRAWWSRRTASGARETTCSKSRFQGEGTFASVFHGFPLRHETKTRQHASTPPPPTDHFLIFPPPDRNKDRSLSPVRWSLHEQETNIFG